MYPNIQVFKFNKMSNPLPITHNVKARDPVGSKNYVATLSYCGDKIVGHAVS